MNGWLVDHDGIVVFFATLQEALDAINKFYAK